MKVQTILIRASIYFLLAVTGLHAQNIPVVIPLWKEGAPGFEKLKNLPEQARDWWVKNINDPSLNVFAAPDSLANGTAIVVCPGGGHTALVYNAEGRDAALFLNSLGITALVLKYRLYREPHSPYSKENVRQDIFRAMRMARSLAPRFHYSPFRLGVMGFSAGGELAAWVSYHSWELHAVHPDRVDRLSALPAFQVLIYPGPDALPDSIPSDAPPTFLLASNRDTCCSQTIIELMEMNRKAGIPVELHLYQYGAHAFNMGQRSHYVTIRTWPQRLANWMQDNGWLARTP